MYRKNQQKGGIKVHTLYDIETSIPTFFHITEANVNDEKHLDAIPYEANSFYISDRGYNDFKRLYNIENAGAYFVVRGKKNNDFKPLKWSRRFPKDSGILSDAVGYMNGELTRQNYPDKIRRIIYWDKENGRMFIFFTNALDINPVMAAELYHQRWQIELFFKWLKQHLKIKKILGHFRECGQDTDILGYHSLLYDGHRPERDETQKVNLRDASNHKYLTDRHCPSSRSVRFT